MAPEGAIADAPVTEKPVSTSAAPDPKPASADVKPAASQPEYKWEEDTRTKAQLSDLQKERKARQDHERRASELETQLSEERRRVAALTGLSKPSKQEQDEEEVKEQLARLYPGLKNLGQIEELQRDLEEQQIQAQADHSRRMIDRIYEGVAAEYGELSERQKRRIDAIYLYDNHHVPGFHERHAKGDPALIAEFVKAMVEDLVDPIKKKVTASEASRFRPVPGGRDRSTPVKGEKPKTSEELFREKFRTATRAGAR